MGRSLPKVAQSGSTNKLLKTPNRKTPTGLRNYCMILLMYRAGMRVSEVTGMQSAWINWKDGQLRILGKGKVERVVPLELWVLDSLKEWKSIRPSSKYFFCTLGGAQVQRRYVNAMLERYSERAGIEHVNPHMLRHTYATELLNEGYNVREVQNALGHSDLKTTMIYTHVNPVEFRDKIRTRRMPI